MNPDAPHPTDAVMAQVHADQLPTITKAQSLAARMGWSFAYARTYLTAHKDGDVQ